MTAIVSLRNVKKSYLRGKQKVEVLHGVDLEIEAGEFLALMGPSGSGKTTMLNLIAGLDQPTSGEVVVSDKRIDKLSRGALADWRARNIGFIFQFYNLLPVLTAEANVEVPLLLTNLSRAQRRERVQTALQQRFKDAMTSNPALALDVLREPEYFKQASKGISRVISFLAYFVGGIMAVGAVFGALNTMYSAVSERLREIATLRALGFGATAMIVSVLAEALLLAFIGGVIGAVLAWIFFNGNTVSTGGTAQGQLIFDLRVSPELMVVGIVWAAVIGLIGGLFPAIRAARLPVATALRAI